MSAAECMSGASRTEQANEWAVWVNGQASGPVLPSGFLVALDYSAIYLFYPISTWTPCHIIWHILLLDSSLPLQCKGQLLSAFLHLSYSFPHARGVAPNKGLWIKCISIIFFLCIHSQPPLFGKTSISIHQSTKIIAKIIAASIRRISKDAHVFVYSRQDASLFWTQWIIRQNLHSVQIQI